MDTKALQEYNDLQVEPQKTICDKLLREIHQHLDGTPNLTAKIWHGAPVWFSDGNPIVGYWARKSYVQLLFWSGQSFDEPDLHIEGSFKAAEARYTDIEQVDTEKLSRWLDKAVKIQWDYKNIVKNKGQLDRL